MRIGPTEVRQYADRSMLSADPCVAFTLAAPSGRAPRAALLAALRTCLRPFWRRTPFPRGRAGVRRDRDGWTVWFAAPPGPAGLLAGRALRASLRRQPDRPAIPARVARQWHAELERWRVLAHLIVAARRRDIPASLGWNHRLPVLRLGEGQYRHWFYGTVSSHDRAASLLVGQDKLMTRAFLESLGVPVPPGVAVRGLAETRRAAARLGFPLVLKRTDASNGSGVVPDIRDRRALHAAYWHLRRTVPREPLLLERFVAGRYYRVLVVDGRCVRVAEGRSLAVIGDGRRSVRQLLVRAGRSRLLGEWWLRDRLRGWLLPRGLSIDGVPARGARISVSPPTGRWRDRTGEIHADTRLLLEHAARQLTPGTFGIDVVCGDIARPLVAGRDAVIELNPCPGTWFHEAPVDVAATILSRLFPGPSRVPIVCVVGPDAAATARAMRGAPAPGGDGEDPRRQLGDVDTTVAFVALDAETVELRGIPFDRCRAVVVSGEVSAAILRVVLGTLIAGGRVAVHPAVTLPATIRTLARRRRLDVVTGDGPPPADTEARVRRVRPVASYAGGGGSPASSGASSRASRK